MLKIRQVSEQQINAALNEVSRTIDTEIKGTKQTVAEQNAKTQKKIDEMSNKLDKKLNELDSAIGDNIEYLNDYFVPNTRTVNDKRLNEDIELTAQDVGALPDTTHIPVDPVQADWTETDNTKLDYIKNKPNLATVATSGSYNDLSDKPTIPAAQVNSDWNASSGVAQILNKPDLSTYNSKITVSADTAITDFGDATTIHVNGEGTNPTSIKTRTALKLWDYIKGKISSVLGLSTTGLSTGTVTTTGDIHVGKGKSIYADGTKANVAIIKMKDNTVDTYGNGVVIGGGGATVIGGGESADTYYSGASLAASSETMAVTNDGAITFVSNLQDGYANGKVMTMGTDGKLTNNQGFVGNLSGNADTATASNRVNSSYITIKTGSTAQAKISLNTLMTWLMHNDRKYIPSNTACYRTILTTWSYAGNDILQLSANGVAYELQLAGVVIEFLGTATSYTDGVFRLRIHSSPTTSFTVTSGYTVFPTNRIAEYTCNGSGYTPTWRIVGTDEKMANGFWGMTDPSGTDTVWIRTTNQGLIPYQSGGAGSGHQSLGTSSWYFSKAYIDTIYGHLSGYADQADYTRGNAYCTTDGATQAKVASMRGYVLRDGATFPITFTNANSYNGVITLNVNSTGAKNIYINGHISSSSNKTLPAATYLCNYNGVGYYIDTQYAIPKARHAASAATADNGCPVGAIMAFYRTSAPSGWLECKGQTYNTTTYATLYSVIGTNTLPDLRNKALMGYNDSSTLGNTSTVGTVQAAQLPKTTGRFGYVSNYRGELFQDNSALYKDGSTGLGGWASGGGENFNIIGFDDTKGTCSTDHLGNNVHAANGEVRPANLRVRWCIKAT